MGITSGIKQWWDVLLTMAGYVSEVDTAFGLFLVLICLLKLQCAPNQSREAHRQYSVMTTPSRRKTAALARSPLIYNTVQFRPDLAGFPKQCAAVLLSSDNPFGLGPHPKVGKAEQYVLNQNKVTSPSSTTISGPILDLGRF